MSPADPRSWIDQLVGACVGLLVGAIALYCAVEVLRALLPFVVASLGVLALGIGIVAAVRWYRGRW
ncbi:hypothetical protein [Rhodococcus aetherivorans]|uniref:hypothetical protein n=1 Tax=Rhodococcus aetherivorans TaxID=191292 RepID=UPI000622D0EC|nr:hypothetical protein [Rhodococcus aetherivorans]AKE89619.1 hypothetical protein AAT18_10700 [Rhodococcus aetherivorans]